MNFTVRGWSKQTIFLCQTKKRNFILCTTCTLHNCTSCLDKYWFFNLSIQTKFVNAQKRQHACLLPKMLLLTIMIVDDCAFHWMRIIVLCYVSRKGKGWHFNNTRQVGIDVEYKYSDNTLLRRNGMRERESKKSVVNIWRLQTLFFFHFVVYCVSFWKSRMKKKMKECIQTRVVQKENLSEIFALRRTKV